MIRFKLIPVFLLVFLYYGYGQMDISIPDIIPPSPTVSNLMKFEEVPVNNYTGQPVISIPLYSKKVHNGPVLNLGLSYNTQGIKVNNVSGWTGTGWSLNGLGVISRTVRDVPDEAIKGSPGFSNKTGVLHNPDFWNYDSLSGLDKAEFNWKAVGSSADKYDIQLDLYQFNFFNYSGRFVVLKQGSQLVAKFISQNDNIKIDISYDSSLTVSGFTVTDPNGMQYIFNKVETTAVTSGTESKPQGNSENSTSGSQDNYNVNTSWHLSKVRNSNNVDVINFIYSSIQEIYTSQRNYVFNDILSQRSDLNDMLQNDYNLTIMEPKEIVSNYLSSTWTQKLSRIEFDDGVSIDFIKGLNHPENSGAILDEIVLNNANNTINKRFVFAYDITDRLWLTEVKEIAGSETQTTTLTYIDKQNLPAFGEINETDDWGYYSGIQDAGEQISGCVNSPAFNEDQILTGLLKSIKYPTGGVKEFTFEHNAYSYIGNESIQEAQYLNNPVNSSRTSFNYFFDHPNNQSINKSFNLTVAQKIYVNVNVSSSQQPNLYRLVIEDEFGSSVAHIDIQTNGCKFTTTLPAGSYTIQLRLIDGSIDPYSATGFARVHFIGSTGGFVIPERAPVQQGIRKEMIGGGVRIKRVDFFEDASYFVSSKSIEYNYDDSADPEKSSGVIDSESDKLARTYDYNVTKYLFTYFENTATNFKPVTLLYRTTEMGSGVNTQLSQGSYIGYRNVKISESGNGHQIFRYTSPYNYPSPVGTFQQPNSSPVPNIDYKRGLLLEHITYNDAGKPLVKKTNLSYNFVENFLFRERNVYKPKSCEWMQFYDTWNFYSSFTSNAEVNIPVCPPLGNCLNYYQDCGFAPIPQLFIDFNSGWAQLKESFTENYFYNTDGSLNEIVSSTHEYDYNPDNFRERSIKTLYSRGNSVEEIKNEFFYSTDTSIPNLSNDENLDRLKMISLNIVNPPIYTKSYLNNNLLQEQWTVFEEFSPNILKPEYVRTRKSNGLIESRIEYLSYDNYGNPTEVKKSDGASISYLWGYNGEYVLAKIENATQSEVTATGVNQSILTNPSSTDAQRTTELNKVRNGLSNAMVTTYEFKPLVGVTKITDPRGEELNYDYDNFNRLEAILDDDLNLLEEYKYNYRSN